MDRSSPARTSAPPHRVCAIMLFMFGMSCVAAWLYNATDGPARRDRDAPPAGEEIHMPGAEHPAVLTRRHHDRAPRRHDLDRPGHRRPAALPSAPRSSWIRDARREFEELPLEHHHCGAPSDGRAAAATPRPRARPGRLLRDSQLAPSSVQQRTTSRTERIADDLAARRMTIEVAEPAAHHRDRRLLERPVRRRVDDVRVRWSRDPLGVRVLALRRSRSGRRAR